MQSLTLRGKSSAIPSSVFCGKISIFLDNIIMYETKICTWLNQYNKLCTKKILGPTLNSNMYYNIHVYDVK